jgi:trigger factor
MVKQLSGLAAGGEKKITIKLPDDFHDEALRGKDAKIELKVTQVLRAELPEIDEDFAKRLGMDSVETLRKQIGSNIEQERKQGARQQVEQDSVDQLIAACTFDLPEEFMKRQTEAAIMRSTYQLAQMGVTKDFLEERRDEMEKSSREETERSVRRSVIFDAIADKEELDITEAEFQAHIENLSRAYQTTPAKILKRIQDNDGLAAMASEIRDIKVTKLILDSAEITSEEKA